MSEPALSVEEYNERQARLARLLANPALPDIIFEHVANGGTLVDLCETWQVRFSSLSKWINEDEARKKKYADALQARNEWTEEMLLGDLRAMAHFDLRKLYKEDGTLKNIAELDAETARMVQSVEVDEIKVFDADSKAMVHVGDRKKVKLWDKLKAKEMLMKNRRMLVDRHELEGSISLEELVGRSMSDQPAPAPAPAAPPAPAPAETAPAPAEAPKPQP